MTTGSKMIMYIRPGVHGDSSSEMFENLAYSDNVHLIKKGLEYLDQHYSRNFVVLTVSEFWLSDELIEEMTQIYGKIDLIHNRFYSRIDLKTNVPFHLSSNFLKYFAPDLVDCSVSNITGADTQYCFNFIVNRKRVNRHLMIQLLEHFDLIRHADYTYSKSDPYYDLSIIIDQLNNISAPWATEILSSILGPIELEPKWISTPKDKIIPGVNIKTQNTNAWNAGLNKIFAHSAVSLISESVDYQDGIGFTEKSMFPVLGLTIPIWVGGKYQASEFEKYGFDVFSDIVDHSYQYCDTLIERCYRAITDNLHILSDLEYASQTRQKLMPRLVANQNRLLHVIHNPESQEFVTSNPQKNIPKEFDAALKKLFDDTVEKLAFGLKFNVNV